MATKGKSEKKQHIQVFTRVRPLSTQELKSQVVVECISSREVSVRDKCQTKTFTFDKVFGPDSKQIDVYKAVVGPLISEVLQGYNCTVFAYGQTGTGKTFTMVGEKSQHLNKSWEEDPSCGVIPRTLSHLFDELKVRADEFTVRVSFLELYNEELCDLLAPNDGDDSKSLKLFEDSMKKGSVIVSGLEERTVHNKNDVYAILEAGNLRRQTAPTLMNAQSSRSHTIFTITVHIKVTTPEGEDLIKTGKLNLVDLAGSENIGRSGAVDMRAREAGNINQSLLTLGRVITSLVERTPHIPYRESKLTRILQDSLGGRTKTSIIATVSPALCNIEETLSTFDYAHRARNITNKPEINQKTSKRVLLKEYTEEIERLRRDLIATREKHGVYLASENYNAIMAEKENLNKELVAKLQLLKVREDELAKQEEILKSLNMNLFETRNELAATSEKLQEAKKLCIMREDMLHKLSKQTNELLKTADEAVNDAKSLHDRLDKSRMILEHNFTSSEKFKNNFCWNLGNMKNRMKDFLSSGIGEVESQMESEKHFLLSVISNQMAVKEMTTNSINSASGYIQSAIETTTDQTISNQTFLSKQLRTLQSVVDSQNQYAQSIIQNLIEHSQKMESDCSILRENFEKSVKILQQQNSNIESLQKKMAELLKLIKVLPSIYNEKLKLREEELKSYKEKCEFLEKKQSGVDKQIEDFGSTLYAMAQDYMQLLQRRSECEEALCNVRNDQKCKEESLLKDICGSLVSATTNISKLTEQTGTIVSKVDEAVIELLENSEEVGIPLLNRISDTHEKWTNSMETVVKDNTESLNNCFTDLKELCEAESQKINHYTEDVENKFAETLKIVNNLNTWVNDNTNQQGKIFEQVHQDILRRKLSLTAQITDHSEELFSNIHDRVKEMDIFFSEGIKKDEKTGQTPQRKEFHYPKQILSFSNRNVGVMKPDEITENSNSDWSDVDSLSDDKENISKSLNISED